MQGRALPLSLITGFLGSGKTTLINRILKDAAFTATAVIVNELSEVGLDHDLIETSDDQVMTLTTGCLCCQVQTDLSRTLMDLHRRRASGSIFYDRVLIETSGLADPAPILQALISDPDITQTHRAPYVVTLVDAIHGEITLQDHPEARHQVAVADQLLISKTDQQPPSARLLRDLDALNKQAPRLNARQAQAADLFGTPGLQTNLPTPPTRSDHRDIDTFVLARQQPIPALALTMLLQAIQEHCGNRLLRLKGLVELSEMPGQPAVIHGVRHSIATPEFLGRWPSQDRTTRIIFITKGVPRYFVPRLLEAIEAEVQDATR